jgi:AcrR family transcriptional regulator
MVAATAALLGTRGLAGTSFTDVLAQSRAPRGSIYHHFPNGKRELVVAAVQQTTRQILTYQRTCTARTPAGVLDHFVELFRQSLRRSECRAGCPVAGVALNLDAGAGDLRTIVRSSFRAWTRELTRQLVATGLPRPRARNLALTTLASVEGALVLSRAEGSLAPLELVARELRRLASTG